MEIGGNDEKDGGKEGRGRRENERHHEKERRWKESEKRERERENFCSICGVMEELIALSRG